MKEFLRKIILSVMLSFTMLSFSTAAVINVAISQLSPATTETFKNYMLAIAEETNSTFEIQIVPAARALYLIENNQVDIAMPKTIIRIPSMVKDFKYDYSTALLPSSAYVLYTSKSKNITAAELKKGNPKGYNIETNSSLVDMFEFKAQPSTSIEASLKKVDTGTIDGYLYSQISTDAALKTLGLKNIKRQYYKDSELGFMIKKGTIGSPIDKILVDGTNKLKANGKFDKFMGDAIKQGKYDDWQP
jgi:polar amino acid transport system substrate-binding protein